MLILWRFLIGHFLKVAFVCVAAFVTVLLTMRLEMIAHFATLGAQSSHVALFVLHQVPYMLPIALPISCLIASILLMQRLSKTHELTAFRGCGFGLATILFPLLATAFLLALANFYVVSEVATQSHLTTNALKSQLRAVNPLLLLHNKHLMRLKGVYFKSMGSSRLGEFAADTVLAIPNRHSNRISIIVAKQLSSNQQEFIGEDIALISVLKGEQNKQFDPLLIENIKRSSMAVIDFADVLQKKAWKVNNDYLTMAMLLVQLKEQKKLLDEAREEGQFSENIKALRHQYHANLSEIARRLSISFAVFSFTLMGCAFGISIGRHHGYRSIYLAIILATTFVMAFFTAKGLEKNWIAAFSLYMIPHVLIVVTSIIILNRMNRGIE